MGAVPHFNVNRAHGPTVQGPRPTVCGFSSHKVTNDARFPSRRWAPSPRESVINYYLGLGAYRACSGLWAWTGLVVGLEAHHPPCGINYYRGRGCRAW